MNHVQKYQLVRHNFVKQAGEADEMKQTVDYTKKQLRKQIPSDLGSTKLFNYNISGGGKADLSAYFGDPEKASDAAVNNLAGSFFTSPTRKNDPANDIFGNFGASVNSNLTAPGGIFSVGSRLGLSPGYGASPVVRSIRGSSPLFNKQSPINAYAEVNHPFKPERSQTTLNVNYPEYLNTETKGNIREGDIQSISASSPKLLPNAEVTATNPLKNTRDLHTRYSVNNDNFNFQGGFKKLLSNPTFRGSLGRNFDNGTKSINANANVPLADPNQFSIGATYNNQDANNRYSLNVRNLGRGPTRFTVEGSSRF